MAKIPGFFVCALYAAASYAELPSVTVSEVSQDSRRNVTVSYTLSGADAFVTAGFYTNGILAAAVGSASGDVNCRVAPGVRLFKWDMRRDFPDWRGEMSVRVTATPPGKMPEYLVIDLVNRGSRAYCATAADVPGGVLSDVYKTDRMLMRKIAARGVVWRMGQPAGGELSVLKSESGYGSPMTVEECADNETGHRVMLTEDFYMAVYETTQGQYRKVMGTNPSEFASSGDKAPVENVSYDSLRGAVTGEYSGWPADEAEVAEGSVIWTFRDFTGLEGLDLPTEAQWEFACRAGTGTSLNNGENITNPMLGVVDPAITEIGWLRGEGASRTPTHEVGLLAGNAFGLYDMHGNVAEFCLDWVSTGDGYRATFCEGWDRGAVTIDPRGAENGTARIVRGGSMYFGSGWARSAARVGVLVTPGTAARHYGFRLVLPAGKTE